MFWEIEVRRDGQHLFTTSPNSAPSIVKARMLYKVLRERFPHMGGFEVKAYEVLPGRKPVNLYEGGPDALQRD